MTDPDAYWRRPAPGDGAEPAEDASAAPPPTPREPGYQGPPRAARPPAGWRTPTVPEPHTPRELPPQDHAALDAEEAGARGYTYGMAILAAAVVLVLIFIACARVIG